MHMGCEIEDISENIRHEMIDKFVHKYASDIQINLMKS